MSVIIARALPDVRDGLKPVQRRVLYAMDELATLQPRLQEVRAHRRRGARQVPPARRHRHLRRLVRLAQDFSMRYPLIDGQGNFGSIDGDSAGGHALHQGRLSHIAAEMLADLDKDTVDFAPNYDGKERADRPADQAPEPLVNGSSGIAVGMATNIPPHNLREIVSPST